MKKWKNRQRAIAIAASVPSTLITTMQSLVRDALQLFENRPPIAANTHKRRVKEAAACAGCSTEVAEGVINVYMDLTCQRLMCQYDPRRKVQIGKFMTLKTRIEPAKPRRMVKVPHGRGYRRGPKKVISPCKPPIAYLKAYPRSQPIYC